MENVNTKTPDDFFSLIEEMLERPLMHAQNPASLEDQVVLLLSLAHPDHFEAYKSYTFLKVHTIRTAASIIKDYDGMVDHLKEFVGNIR